MNEIVNRYSFEQSNQYSKSHSDYDSLNLTEDIFKLQPELVLAPLNKPIQFSRNLSDEKYNKDCQIKLAHGTTTLAFKFNGGIIVAVDSRATQGTWIASQTVNKVIRINENLLGTMAGGAADCQYWETWLGIQCRIHELRNKERISVSSASKILSNLVYQYKNFGLSMGTMICGYTPKEGFAIYYVNSEGMRLNGNIFCVGSGQTFAYSVLDTDIKPDLTLEEALYLGKRSILAATHRDAYSGGSINLYHISEDGWTYHGNHDVGDIFWEIKNKEQSFENVK